MGNRGSRATGGWNAERAEVAERAEGGNEGVAWVTVAAGRPVDGTQSAQRSRSARRGERGGADDNAAATAEAEAVADAVTDADAEADAEAGADADPGGDAYGRFLRWVRPQSMAPMRSRSLSASRHSASVV